MAEQYTNVKRDRRSLFHTGTELGADQVTLSQNETGREDDILQWECPRKYSQITYSAGQHYTKFTPRGLEELDGDGSSTTFSLTANIDPPAGETNIDDMVYQPVVAYDSAAASQLTVASYDFDVDEVTFESAPNSGTGNVQVFFVITEGTIKYVGEDQFGHRVAALDRWGIPIRVFNDFNTDKNMTQVHLTGAVDWEESEILAIALDGPRQIVWDHANYPEGDYVSKIEQRVDIDV